MDIVKNQSCLPVGYINCSLQDQQQEYLTSQTFKFILFSIVGFFIFVFNCGVFILIIREKKIRGNPYYFLVLMLSISDFAVGLGITCICVKQIVPHLRDNKILTTFQIVLMTTGLYLSLLQIFLISLQRYLIICKEKVHAFFFRQKRKYFMCFGCWISVVMINCVLVSPSSEHFNPDTDQFLQYVYSGHFFAHTIYSRLLSMSVLLFTITLYVLTIKHIKMQSLRVQPTRKSNVVHLKAANVSKDQQSPPTGLLDSKGKIATSRTAIENHAKSVQNPIVQIRHKKVMSTVYLVRLLIGTLLIFTGPLIVTFWIDKCTPRVMGILFCLNITNALVNPFLYIWKLLDFRKHLKSALCCFSSVSPD